MKIAIALCGNLRTFLMPIDNKIIRLCDKFIEKIVLNNSADVFAFTDTNDFFYNNVQYFATERRIEVLNNDTSRLHNKIDFLNNDSARNIILEQFSIFGKNLKFLCVEDPYDAFFDLKFKHLAEAKIEGNNPILLIQQLRKMKLSYNAIEKYENDNNFKYDIILKWRFDNTVNDFLNLQEYDYLSYDVYVPGIHSPVIYDWFAYGNNKSMAAYLSLYDIVGSFLSEGNVYICDKCKYYGGNINHNCQKTNKLYDISLSVEYHLFRMINDRKIKIGNSKYQSCPKRYNENGEDIDVLMKRMNIDATLVTYTPGVEIIEKRYNEKN